MKCIRIQIYLRASRGLRIQCRLCWRHKRVSCIDAEQMDVMNSSLLGGCFPGIDFKKNDTSRTSQRWLKAHWDTHTLSLHPHRTDIYLDHTQVVSLVRLRQQPAMISIPLHPYPPRWCESLTRFPSSTSSALWPPPPLRLSSRLSGILARGRGAWVCHVGGNRLEPATYALPSLAICLFCCRRSLTKWRPSATTSRRLARILVRGKAGSQAEVTKVEVNLKS